MLEPDRKAPYLGCKPLTPTGEEVERRLHNRLVLDRHGQIEVDGEFYHCRVLDISGSGSAILCAEAIQLGSKAILHIPEIGPIPTCVARELVEGYGLSFDLPKIRMDDLNLRLRILTDLRHFM